MLKAAGNWGRDCIVVKNPLGEPGRTKLYVGLPSTWGSVDEDQIFSPFSRKGPYWGLWQI